MIRRALCWIADWFADTEWLHKMQHWEAEANASADKQERRQNFMEHAILGDRTREDR